MADQLVALLPLYERMPLEDFPPFVEARDAAAASAKPGDTDPPEVSSVNDDELKAEVAELYGESVALDIPCKCELPYIVLQLRDMDRFVSFSVVIADHERRLRTLHFCSKQSTIRIKAFEVSMPLKLVPGAWNYLNLDLGLLTEKAFGTSYQRTRRVVVHGDCRVGRIFFQDKVYEDAELPEFLRVIK